MSPSAQIAFTRGYTDGFFTRPCKPPESPEAREAYLRAYQRGAMRGAPKESRDVEV